MKKDWLSLAQKGLFLLLGALMILLLSYLALVPNVEIRQNRTAQGYEIIKNVAYTEIEEESAPVGMIREYRFVLEETIEHDTTLAFYVSHHYVEVFVDGEEIYSLYPSENLPVIKTTGRNWVTIPVYTSDAGKEVSVHLIPIYKNYKDDSVDFMLGSTTSVFLEQLKNSLPELILSLTVFFTGLLLLGITFYNTLKNQAVSEHIYGLAMLAVSVGLWRFSDTGLSPMIGNGKTTMMYYMSILMLMICAVAILLLSDKKEQKKCRNLLKICTIIVLIIYVVQLFLQIFGISDIRESLTIVHMILVAGALILIGTNIFAKSEKKTGNFAWILGVGILLDLIVYYIRGSSFGLLFVLLSILAYVLIESAGLIRIYWSQKNLLEETKNQLTMSRITTMYSQIRSHFVFNILNAISGMCKYDPEKADETIVRFSRYLRNNINIMEDDKLIPFTMDLQHLEDYFLLEQVRFGEKIEFVTDIEVEDFMIPPLVLQPLVENAIKHGLSKTIEGGIIMLRTWKENDEIFISIEDDGVGFDEKEAEKEGSVGLKNIRFRLKHLMKGTLKIESELGKGTRATITIPGKEANLCESFM